MGYLMHKFLNILLPPITIISLIFFLPFYFVYKFFNYIKRLIWRENVAGKVVLITGASSGIGENIAYEYARRGARLALVARREDRLKAVAVKSRELGSPDVIVIPSDVTKIEDCKLFVDQTCHHFGRLDHLVNNAGILHLRFFEDYTQISDCHPIMNTNFWGSVYATHFAVPWLKKTKGKLVIIASVGGWFPTARLSFYNASKAALITFFDTLRTEFGSDIGITISTPGTIESDIVPHEKFTKVEKIFVRPASSELCAKSIVNGTCRGQRYITDPSWYSVTFIYKVLCPEVLEWFCRFMTITGPKYFT